VLVKIRIADAQSLRRSLAKRQTMQRQFARRLDIGVECADSAAIERIFNVVFREVASLFISLA
jgi:hypothetical protein